MANISSLSLQNPSQPKFTGDSSIMASAIDLYSACDDAIPTIDYSLLFSNDPHQRSLALEYLGQACHHYGFFNLVNHGIPDKLLDNFFHGISEFFDPMMLDERRALYSKKDAMDRIRWVLRSSSGENREYLKVISHPNYHFPPNPSCFSEVLGEYHKEMRKIVVGLARAVSINLGFEEDYIEKAFNLKSGFDVSAMILYPPNHISKGEMGLPEHTDPGFIVTLVQNVDGGLQILSHHGKWINVQIPPHAILIQLGDHLEILTNGKYKSHIHRVVVAKNEVERISVATLHGPSLEKSVRPAPEFVDETHPQAYLGMTYKQCLEANGDDEIESQSSLHLIKLPNIN
ncbi:flavanone 3-dioxygenase 3-like [Senna tora]|uniref:Flavanone 3-dioxygenase 3-like n=1 Tax=Senna tora TaxID=362788 RepID=A0A834T6J5_9FABA|nr:flavanone 3-dioxygenase 3-like [Senna tora]